MKKNEAHDSTTEVEEQFNKLRSNQQPLTKHCLLDSVQRRHHSVSRVRQCSTIPIKNTNVITLTCTKNKGSHIYGVAKCGNKTCIVCSNQATAKQTEQVEEIVNTAIGYELPIYFSTFTIARSNSIATQWKMIGKIQQEFKRRLKKLLLKEFGVEFTYIFNKDFTFTKDKSKGIYHTHLHGLFILNKGLQKVNKRLQDKFGSNDPNEVFKAIVKDLWTITAEHFNSRATIEGQDVQDVNPSKDMDTIANYVVKISKNNQKITYEVSRNTTKQSKHNNSFGLFEMLEKIANDTEGEKSLIRIYKTFTKFVAGKQFFSKARGIKDFLEQNKPLRTELDVENLDLDLVAIEEGNDTEEEEDEEKISVDMSASLFKNLTSLELRGKLFQTIEGQWEGKNEDSYRKLVEISDFSLDIKDYYTHIEQTQLLKPHIHDFFNALKRDNLISDYHQQKFNKIFQSTS